MRNNLPPLIIGLAGEPSSGKDTVAAYLVTTYGFKHVSTGDLIRFYIAEHNLGEPTRDLLHVISNQLRTEHGPDYLAFLALQYDVPHLVISGLRNPSEAALIQKKGGYILALRASLETRYRRAKERKRIGDDISFEVFCQQEQVEEYSSNPNAQAVATVLAMGDYEIFNDANKEELYDRIEELLDILTTKVLSQKNS